MDGVAKKTLQQLADELKKYAKLNLPWLEKHGKAEVWAGEMQVLFEWNQEKRQHLEVVCLNPRTHHWREILLISWNGEVFSAKTPVGEHPARFTITDLRESKKMFCEYILTYYHS